MTRALNTYEKLSVCFHTAKLLRSQWWSSKRKYDYQQRALGRILDHALTHIPYYRGYASKISPGSRPADALRALPTITKQDVRANSELMQWQAIAQEQLFRSRSSGSTGEPTDTVFDRRAWLITKYAAKARRVLSTKPRTLRLATVTERADDNSASMNSLSLGGKIFASTNLYVDDPIDTNVDKLLLAQPRQAYGFPSYFTYLAEHLENRGLRPPEIPVIFTSSETLSEPMRQRIAEAFHARVYDVYGSTEFKEIAVECPHGRYHVNFESVYVESTQASPKQPARLLVTTLVNRAMPLLRYDLGDLGQIGTGDCECGRSGPYLFGIQGRSAELVHFPQGAAVSPYVLMSAVDENPKVQTYSVVQTAPWDLELRIFARPALNESEIAKIVASVEQAIPKLARVKAVMLDAPIAQELRASFRPLSESPTPGSSV